MPTPYTAGGYQEYDYNSVSGLATVSPAAPVDGVVPGTDQNDNGFFDLNEDVTGAGNEYLGYITIDGRDYPVLTGSDGAGNPESTTMLIVVPAGQTASWVNMPSSFDFNTDVTKSQLATCFARGTLIATQSGPTEVERLTPMHRVRTADGRFVPVRWVGHQTLNARLAPGRSLALVTIAAGALGAHVPRRDLTVTADHAMVVDGMLVNASALMNGTTICEVPRAEMPEHVTVYHVETEAHEVLLAEDAPTESFADARGRKHYDNADEYVALYGAERVIPDMDLPRVTAQRLLPAATRERLGIELQKEASAA